MIDLEKTIRDAVLIGSIMTALVIFQGAYNAFEWLRHLAMDGPTDHAASHLKHAWPLILLILFPYWITGAMQAVYKWRHRHDKENN